MRIERCEDEKVGVGGEKREEEEDEGGCLADGGRVR